MLADKLPITGPCPIDLDAIGFDRSSKVSHCSHCAKNVTILSNMTRAEAREFLAEHKGQKLCISYARGEDGRIRFRPDPEPVLIPVARLRSRIVAEVQPAEAARPRTSRTAGFVAALGVGVALAACAPHGEAPRDTATATVPTPSVERNVDGGMRVPGPEVLDEPRPEPPKPVPTGGVAVIPEDVMVDGEIAVPDPKLVDEPCDKAEPKPRKRVVERERPRPPEPIPVAGGVSIPHDVLDGERAMPDLDARG